MKSSDLEDLKAGALLTPVGLMASDIFYEVPCNVDWLKGIYVIGALSSIICYDKLYFKTEEFKKMQELYNKVVDNFVLLCKKFGFKDPLKVYFLFYIVYQKGLLSINHKWDFNREDIKDVPHLAGIDIIRGGGVCRSISAFLDDVYQKMGFDSKILKVAYGDTPTDYIRISNHVINNVTYDGKNIIIDPTNDFLLKPNGNNTLVTDDSSVLMTIKYEKNRLLNVLNTNYNKKEMLEKLNLPTISFEEYYSNCDKTLEIINNNIDMIILFYYENEDLYQEISEASLLEPELFERLIPINRIISYVNTGRVRTKRK